MKVAIHLSEACNTSLADYVFLPLEWEGERPISAGKRPGNFERAIRQQIRRNYEILLRVRPAFEQRVGEKIYSEVKDLPIIDYHCHLDQYKIKDDAKFQNIGELWLAGDHYNGGRCAFRGWGEELITGNSSWREKFRAYASVLPKLAGNPLYYWTHMELQQVFGIFEPLNAESADRIFDAANEKLQNISVSTLLKQYKVEFVATTDDPCDDLLALGKYGGNARRSHLPSRYSSSRSTKVILSVWARRRGRMVSTLKRPLKSRRKSAFYTSFPADAASQITDFAVLHSIMSRIVLPKNCIRSADRSRKSKKRRSSGISSSSSPRLYKKHHIIMQLHFAVTRNINAPMFAKCGADAGFDVIADRSPIQSVIQFFHSIIR